VRPLDAVLAGDHETRHSDVPDLVLAARVGATRDLDLESSELGDDVVGFLSRGGVVEVLADARGDAHALGDGERAVVGAGAGDDVGDVQGVRLAEADFHERAVELVELHRRNPAEDEVLLVRRAQRAVSERSRELGQAVELLGRGVAERKLDDRDVVAALDLGERVGPLPPRERAVADRIARLRRLRRGLFVFAQQNGELIAKRGPALFRNDFELGVEPAQKFLFADLPEQELHPVPLAVLAFPVPEVDAHDGLARRQDVALGHEVEPQVRDLRCRAEPAGHVNGEPSPRIGRLREDADVVDHHLRFVADAAAHADLEFARKLQVHLVVEKMSRDGVGVGRDVERLVGNHAAEGGCGDVAHAVGAGPDGGDARAREHLLNFDRVLELEVVNLDVLAHRDVRAPSAPARRDLGERVHLVRRDDAPGDLDALHVLHLRKLRVDAHPEP
jgi:hypothetical protein